MEFGALSLEDASDTVAEVVAGAPARDGTLDVVGHKQGRWEVKEDGSNHEIASPILRTSSDLERMFRVISQLRYQGAKTDAGTGLHVHVDGMTFAPAQVSRLVALMAKYEPVVYEAFGVDCQRQRMYCRPCRRSWWRAYSTGNPQRKPPCLVPTAMQAHPIVILVSI